jgi:NADH:ubiquinone oxidoreductase subunit E
VVELEGAICLGFCKDNKQGKAPFVKINGQPLEQASMQSVLERIDALFRGEVVSC